MDGDQLKAVLSLHRKWRLKVSEGARAYLAGANLAGANLAGANLAGADLADAYLARANLAGADLANADLADAYLANAYLARANLARANLAGANLADANLANAYLAGANLAGAKGILGVGPIDGWLMYAVRWEDSPRIMAGCRWFTIAKAREHWAPGRDRDEHNALMMAGVDALLSLARAHGWEMPDEEMAAAE